MAKKRAGVEMTEKRGKGRPSCYTQALADEICRRLAEGESLRKICADEHTPSTTTVFKWLAEREDFPIQYARARENQAEFYAAQIIDIADTPILGVTTKISDGKAETTEGDMIQHRRLQVDARKWYASKLYPKKYGERSSHEVTGADGSPLTIEIVRFGEKKNDPAD